MTSIKPLKSGEFKCVVCEVKFKTKDAALKHIKTKEHVSRKNEVKMNSSLKASQFADEQKSENTTLIMQSIQEEQDRRSSHTDQQLSILNSQLELIINKLDLLTERTNHMELRLTHFENQFENHFLKPKIQQQKINQQLQQDLVLQSQISEVKQIELAEDMIRRKVDELKQQKSRLDCSQNQPLFSNFSNQRQNISCSMCGSQTLK